MEDDPRTFRVSGPLPPLEQSPAPLLQNPPASKPSRKKQFLLGLEWALLPVLFALVGVASDIVVFYGLAAFDLVLNITLGVLLLLSRTSWWHGFGFLLGTLLSGDLLWVLSRNYRLL